MVTRIYVGNLPFASTEQDVRAAFEVYGQVSEVKLVTDRETGRLRGFGFVAMEQENATKAINELHQTIFGGRTIVVNLAKERDRARIPKSHDREW